MCLSLNQETRRFAIFLQQRGTKLWQSSGRDPKTALKEICQQNQELVLCSHLRDRRIVRIGGEHGFVDDCDHEGGDSVHDGGQDFPKDGLGPVRGGGAVQQGGFIAGDGHFCSREASTFSCESLILNLRACYRELCICKYKQRVNMRECLSTRYRLWFLPNCGRLGVRGSRPKVILIPRNAASDLSSLARGVSFLSSQEKAPLARRRSRTRGTGLPIGHGTKLDAPAAVLSTCVLISRRPYRNFYFC
jgi:hypothetical protein